MSNTAKIIWKSVGVTLVAAMLISAVVWGYMMTPTDSPCVSLAYIVEDADERMYLTEPELTHLLKSEDLFPVGKQMNIVSLHRIEQAMERHPMVRTAECYLTPRNEMKIRLTQRVPLLRVQTANEIYLIDTDRKVMQARAVVRDSVLVVTGAIGVKMASTQLADFAEWLEEEPYWSTRINHLHVQNPQMIYIYLRDKKQPRVLLGNLHGYESKLSKLRTFLAHSAQATKDKNYTEYDLRIRGQVIGRY